MTLPDKKTLHTDFLEGAGLSVDSVLGSVVGLANAEGGTLLLDLEGPGKAARRRRECGPWRAPEEAAFFIAAHTVPPLVVRAEEAATADGRAVVAIRIQKADCLSGADWLRRLDFSRSTLPVAVLEDLDPAERLRVRRLIARLHGEQRLLDFTDDNFDRELGFLTSSPP